MQLKDYFIEQKNNKLTQNEKFFLYEKIISQKDQKSFARTKRFISIKFFAYGFAMIILFAGIYGVYFFNGNLSYEGFMVQNTLNQANADYIAKIVDFNGDFYIKHQGHYYKTSNISNGDNVILKKGSEIVFHINSGTKAKIIGPAKFTLSKVGDTHQLLLSQGDFVQMESLEQDTNGIKVILDDVTISSTHNTNFLITKQNNQYKINNQGDQLIITQADNTKQLQNKQILTIKDNDISLIENAQDFGQAITDNNISQTFTLTQNDKPSIPEKQVVTTLLKDTQQDNSISDPELAQNIVEDLGLQDDKIIPTTEQSKTLHSLLNDSFVLGNIEEMFKAKGMGNDAEYQYNQGLLSSRIQKIYSLFEIKYPKTNLIDDIKNLKKELINNYHIPDSYIYNLDIIINWINYIQDIIPSSITNTEEEINQLWNNLETNPPSYLIFK